MAKRIRLNETQLKRIIKEAVEEAVSGPSDDKMWEIAFEFIRQNKSFGYLLGVSKEQVLEWLEKQKETIKKQKGTIKKQRKEISDAGWRYEAEHADDWRIPRDMGGW